MNPANGFPPNQLEKHRVAFPHLSSHSKKKGSPHSRNSLAGPNSSATLRVELGETDLHCDYILWKKLAYDDTRCKNESKQ